MSKKVLIRCVNCTGYNKVLIFDNESGAACQRVFRISLVQSTAMEQIFMEFLQAITLSLAFFFALYAGSGVINLYLRYIDHLSFDKEDIQLLLSNTWYAVLLFTCAAGMRYLGLAMTAVILLIMLLIWQMFNISALVRKLKRLYIKFDSDL